ncbi:hypothetical protein VTL71DRAFT_5346 [Oculimacula yallundae]|uniref:Uncharacterized protein n=1 Tax=Oculimacula yallundae TaxID=86028 RepID=A0ABR4C2D9_9HELO
MVRHKVRDNLIMHQFSPSASDLHINEAKFVPVPPTHQPSKQNRLILYASKPTMNGYLERRATKKMHKANALEILKSPPAKAI